MNSVKSFLKKNISKNIVFYPLLVLFGVLWGLGQQPTFFFIRFFGLIIFLYVIFYRKHYILETLLFGWIAYTFNFYWLFITFTESGKLPVLFSIAVPAVLCLYYGLQYPIIAFIYKKFHQFNKKILFYSFPIVFVFVDFLFPKIFRHTIADSQIGFFPFVQLIDITGMAGLILIIMFFNLGLFLLLKKLFNSKKIRVLNFVFIIPFVLALIYGFIRIEYLQQEIKKSQSTYAAMIQGNITGKQKLDESYFITNVERYNKLTKEAATTGLQPEFIIWPESVFNRSYDGNPEFLQQVIYENYPPLILGIVVWLGDRATNSALLIRDRYRINQYDKQVLLLFGEYLPFEKSFPFLRMFTPLRHSSTPGNTSSIFQINNVRASLSICFEDLFPELNRKKVLEGANLMINMTNDSWFGNGLGPLHHSIIARLRGIENRRSLYRCTATGFTTASDFTGKIVAKGNMATAEVIKARLPLNEKRTIYSYIGELFSYLCIIIVGLILLVIIREHFINFRIRKVKKHFGHKKIKEKDLKKYIY